MTELVLEDLAARLKWARGMSGLTALDVCRKAQLSKAHVSMIESGRRKRIDVQTAQAIASVLGISWAWLLSGEGDAPTPEQIRQAIDGAA
jgi:transcriptional regulator with XRE-family HTH domain